MKWVVLSYFLCHPVDIQILISSSILREVSDISNLSWFTFYLIVPDLIYLSNFNTLSNIVHISFSIFHLILSSSYS